MEVVLIANRNSRIRVNLTLPGDHPLVKIELGRRARKARELLDFALAYERQLEDLKAVILSRLDEIEAKIAQGTENGKDGGKDNGERSGGIEIDPLDLLNF